MESADSLIGRAGVKAGRNIGTNSTFYVKADLLHEFLGDQDIKASDNTGSLKETFENKGTWCNVGVGTAVTLSKATQFNLELAKSYGNDLDDSWRVNAGLRWEF